MPKFGFQKKEFMKRTEIIILNFKLLSFMKYENAIRFYKKIKDIYNTKYANFFDYF